MAEVELRGVRKSFPNSKGQTTTVLQGVNIIAPSKQFVVLLGPSGCGKSTSLRIIAGLEKATEGDVLIDGVRVNDIPAARRNIAMVFQNYALYPHLTVMENIVFGLHVRRVPKAEREIRGRAAAEQIGLTDFLDRRPSQLSGGQRQRAALGRALVSDAKVVLMDEPLSNLDAKLRQRMRVELRALQRDLGLTVIYVTHDQVEAMTMADHVVVMRAGRIAQASTPIELYRDPADSEVASFIGSPPMNLIPASREGTGVRFEAIDGLARWEVPVPASAPKDLLVGVRPEDLIIGASSTLPSVVGEVLLVEALGAETIITVGLAGGERVVTRAPGVTDIVEGERLSLHVNHEQIRYFDRETGVRVYADKPVTSPAS